MKRMIIIIIAIALCVSFARAFKPANVWKYMSRSGNIYMVSQDKTFWLYGFMMQSGTGAAELIINSTTFWLDAPDSKSWSQTFDPPIAFDEGTIFSCDIFQGSILIWGYEGDINDDARLAPEPDADAVGSSDATSNQAVSRAD